jgi:hypothetical protein
MKDRTYCEDFSCKHGFVGWWNPTWETVFAKRHKEIEDLLLKQRAKRKADANKPKRKPTEKA